MMLEECTDYLRVSCSQDVRFIADQRFETFSISAIHQREGLRGF